MQENFEDPLRLVKEFIDDVRKVKKQNLYAHALVIISVRL